MTNRERLLGYLLGALEANERDEVERALAASPVLRHELDILRAELAPLDMSRIEYEPPGDLVERTCDRVATCRETEGSPHGPPGHSVSPARRASTRLSSTYDAPSEARGISFADGAVVMGVCIAVSILFFPAIINSREAARRNFCQDNLRRMSVGLLAYADLFGTAPYIPPHGNLAIAGNVPLTLHEMELLERANIVLCPGSESKFEHFQMPRSPDLERATGLLLSYLQRVAGGDYAYTLGVRERRRYGPARFQGRPWFAIAADAPTLRLSQRMTANHGGRGFNLLFEDGHIQFLRDCRLPATGDDVFRSADGYIESGSFEDDSSLGPSSTHPLPHLFRAN